MYDELLSKPAVKKQVKHCNTKHHATTQDSKKQKAEA
jgi:hypothetical protein